MSSTKTTYLENSIRKGFTSEDVRMWQALCRQCELEVGDSIKYMFTVLDIAKHNQVGPLDIVKMGRLCSEQKNVNQKFMEALLLAVYSDGEEEEGEGPFDDDADADVDDKKPVKVLDLTADDDDDLSGSYEETSEKYYDTNDNPTSHQAYEIDGFVVEDDEAESGQGTEAHPKPGVTRVTANGLARSNALVGKRKLRTITEDDEE